MDIIPELFRNSPVARCPCCTFTIRGGTQDGLFKANRRSRNQDSSFIDTFTGEAINITVEELKPVLEEDAKRLQSHRQRCKQPAQDAQPENENCTSNFVSDSDHTKQNRDNDIQGLGAFVCRHGVVMYCFFISRTGERYGYWRAVLEKMKADSTVHGFEIDSGFVLFYDVACRFSKYMKNAYGSGRY